MRLKMRIVNKGKVASTNDYIKRYIKKGRATALFSKFQTCGKGTKGRSFDSQKGGLYCSILCFYQDLTADRNFEIMVKSSLVVIRSLSKLGLKCGIKWPNDILYENKKICGILIENALLGDKISHSIVGVGINLNNSLPKSLSGSAITAASALGKRVNIKKFKRLFLKNLSKENYSLEEYRENLIILNKNVQILAGTEKFAAKVLDIADDGQLVVMTAKGTKKLAAAEVSLRLEEDR